MRIHAAFSAPPLFALALMLSACDEPQSASPGAGGASVSAEPAPAPQPPPLLLTCDGPIRPDATKTSLIGLFGPENVFDQVVPGPEGTTNNATVLFPNDPEKRVEILWRDEKAEAGPLDVSISGTSSAWRGPGGLKLGSTIAEVEQVNGAPFRISGFGWDYGGFVNDWNGGALGVAANCAFGVRFDPAPDATINGVSGEGTFPSNNAKMRAADPHVSRLSIGWAPPASTAP